MARNEYFLKKAEQLRPQLIVQEKFIHCGERIMNKGDEALFDFGDHYVGYLTIDFEPTERHPDSPLYFQIRFFEHQEEMSEDPAKYKGWISPSWIQQEQIHIDVIPCSYRLERRYAFRYVKITILRSSGNFPVKLCKLTLNSVSSADDTKLIPFNGREEDRLLDRVAVRTLHECMQEVFEDGPKRDQRLWLGDLRLQALANYETYRDLELIKRCLYLFAGDTLENGLVANNMFVRPKAECDSQYMVDYSLFFISTLWDYYEASGDVEALKELEPIAYHQYELFSTSFDEQGLLDLSKAGNCFVDWSQMLEKQASGHAIYIYALKDLVKIEHTLGKETALLEKEIQAKSEAARKHWFDKKKGLFVGGKYRKISYATQIWMVLAGVVTGTDGARILERVEKYPFATKPATPYLYHHYIQALIDCGEKKKAYEKMTAYWGGMCDLGADTFWELYNPGNPKESPYGGKIIHSYCHAWSCTPCYFLRKYYKDGFE